MASRISTLTIDAHNPASLARFWQQALGWEADDDGTIYSLAPAGGGAPGIDVVPVPEPKTVKNRLHLDLSADGCTQEEEVGRLIGLGG